MSPPEETRLETWWHWQLSHVTKAGITADLEAMRTMEIRRAHLFVNQSGGFPAGPETCSAAWWELVDHAIGEARRCGIELGFHNCPGWSSSGGPWIHPEDAMKMVTWSETETSAPGTVRLVQPLANNGFYRDLAVFALKLDAATPTLVDAADSGDPINTKAKSFRHVRMLSFAAPFSPRYAVVQFADVDYSFDCEIEASVDGTAWRKVGGAWFNHFNGKATPVPIRLSGLPESGAKIFRIIVKSSSRPNWGAKGEKHLVGVTFCSELRLEGLEVDDAGSKSLRYEPPKASAKGTPREAFVDVTSALGPDGAITWTREGKWRFLRLGVTSMGVMNRPSAFRGLECDKLSRRGIESHWVQYPSEMKRRGGETVTSVTIDSFEVGEQNWTDSMPEEFARRRGYDLKPFLPVLAGYVVDSTEATARFRFDFGRTVSDLFAENYYGRFAELAQASGMEGAAECTAGPFDWLSCMRHVSVPMGEFWIGRSAAGSPRVAASGAHVAGIGVVAAEAFTSSLATNGWATTPADLKRVGDAAWLQGVNRFVFHSYLHQPYGRVKPGVSMGSVGTQFNGNLTWWKEGLAWSRFVQRSQFLLQRGVPCADILVFGGEGRPLAQANYPKDLVAAGYDFDFLSAEELDMPRPNFPCKMLSLGNDRFLSTKVLRRVKALLNAGVKVAGLRPVDTPTLSDDLGEWKRLVDELWGGKYRGKLVEQGTLAGARAFGLRPALDAKGTQGLEYLRREADGATVFFVCNRSETSFDGEVSVAAKGKVELWDAVKVTMDGVASESDGSGRVKFRLRLPAWGSAFVVVGLKDVRTPEPPRRTVAWETPGGPWKVTFDGPGAPQNPVTMRTLSSWSESTDPEIRYFSGRATYTRTFTSGRLAEGERVTLKLGDVRDVATVKLNGCDLGTLWTAPFEVEITDAWRDGENRLEVTVVNCWPNRMIGDALTRKSGKVSEPSKGGVPEWVLAGKASSGSGLFTWSNWGNAWPADSALRPAGLLGPVSFARTRPYGVRSRCD